MILLDKIPENSSVYIYGAGSAGQALYACLLKCRKDILVMGFVDSYADGYLIKRKVYNFKSFLKLNLYKQCDYIVIASSYQKEIKANLKNHGIDNVLVANAPSYLLKEILPQDVKYKIIEKLIAFLASLTNFYDYFSPKKNHLFFGENGGKFIGNNKYYFLQVKNDYNGNIFWVVNNRTVFDELRSENIPVLLFSSLRTKWLLFRSQCFYFDNMTWQRSYPWLKCFNTKIIHMSHGVGLKYTERMMIPEQFIEQLSEEENTRLNESIFKNDLLISTSEFYAREVSSPAYSTPLEKIICSGYPKNDLFYKTIEGADIYTDKYVLEKIDDMRKEGKKIIVYAPTFRDMDSDFDYTSIFDIEEFKKFLITNDLLFVIKGHTSISMNAEGTSADISPVLFYKNDKDGYPLLKRADMLITDYSSIYMDFLHTNKPIVFFSYDIKTYLQDHRNLQFDYFEMTPGPKAYTQQELIALIEDILILNNDTFVNQRVEIRNKAFSYSDGDSWKRIKKRIDLITHL